MNGMKKDTDHIRFAVAGCSLGAILVAATGRGICAITLGDDANALKADLRARFPEAHLMPGGDELYRQVVDVVAFIEAPATGLALSLDPRGTDFQRRVWAALREIAPGTTASYTDIAARIGQPSAVRAVAQACAANPIAVAIPCHRIVARDGALSGYRWGAARKQKLLDREAA